MSYKESNLVNQEILYKLFVYILLDKTNLEMKIFDS